MSPALWGGGSSPAAAGHKAPPYEDQVNDHCCDSLANAGLD
jgi:hypothetical protein